MTSMQDLGSRIARLEKMLSAQQRASRLGSASLDDTALAVRGPDGGLRAVIGQQADGTTAMNVVNGGPPPAPSTPTVAPALGGIAATWDGTFAGGAPAPLDWSRIEVHASPTSGFTPAAGTLQATIETPQGATAYIAAAGPQYVVLLARNTSGTASAPTAQVGPYAPRTIVDTDVADGSITETKIAPDAVTTPKIKAGSIQTAQLDALAVTTAKLAAGSVDAVALSATAITGKTITGGTVSGATVTGGVVQTGTSGRRAVLNPASTTPLEWATAAPTIPGLELHSGAAAELVPGVVVSDVDNASPSLPFVGLFSPSVATDPMYNFPITANLRLTGPQYGARGGAMLMQANNALGGNANLMGRAKIYGYTGDIRNDVSHLELYCENGDQAPGGDLNIQGARSWVSLDGASVQLRATNSTANGTLTVTPSTVAVTGAVIKTDSVGAVMPWRIPGVTSGYTYNSGWAAGSVAATRYQQLQYRIDAEDNLHICGTAHATTAVAAGSYTLVSLAAPYIPKKLHSGPGLHVSSADALKATIRVNIDNTGSVNFTTTSAVAVSDGIYLNLVIPLGNIA